MRTYATDLTEAQWALVDSKIREGKPGGRPRSIDVHAVVNAAELERRLAPAEQTNQPDPNARVIRPAEYY
jgi:hypothetical protein